MRSLLRIIVIGLICAAHSVASAAALAAGDTPPDYVGRTLGKDAVNLSAYQGKAVVLTFWATWCPYCLKELPILENLQRKAGKDLQVIAVNTENYDTFRNVARAMKTLELRIAYDPEERAAKSFGVNGIPHLVIIGRDGKIQAVYRGYSESSLPAIVADINVATGATPKPSPAGAL
jgi:thiol-disulfide isomerase/thioredoxin